MAPGGKHCPSAGRLELGHSLNACQEVGGQRRRQRPATTTSAVSGRKSDRLKPGVTGVKVGGGAFVDEQLLQLSALSFVTLGPFHSA